MYFLNLKFKIYGVIWKKNLELLLNDLNHCTLRVYVCVACVDGFDPTAPRLGPLSTTHNWRVCRSEDGDPCLFLSLSRDPIPPPARRCASSPATAQNNPADQPSSHRSLHTQVASPPYFARCIELLQSGDPSIHDPPSRPWIDLSFSW